MKLEKSLTLVSEFEEVEKAEILLNELQDELGFDNDMYAKLMLTVSEAITNAIVHGNGLDSDKKVSVLCCANSKELKITVNDEGEGFNPEELPDPLEEDNLLKPSGRGVFLMKEYADDVEYSSGGKSLTLKFYL